MFTPSRLLLARMRRGYTKTRLASESGVTSRCIRSYEAGKTEPGAAAIQALARVLGFPKSFFAAPDVEIPTRRAASFRALVAMTAKQRDAALGAGALAVELASWIGNRFDLPAVDVPDCPQLDAETAAESVRAAWGLGQRPIRNMVHLLEAHGIRVFSLAEENRTVDAFSFWWGGSPYVFLNTQKSPERSRMDAAHELAHLVLHREGPEPGRECEAEANRYAAAMLMPRSSVLASVSGLVTLPRLIVLKRTWNVSVAALACRLHDLKLITDWQYRTLCIQINQRGYRTNEPNSVSREASQLLEQVFTLLRKEGVEKNDLARKLDLRRDDLDALVFELAMISVPGGRNRGSKPNVTRVPDLRIIE